MLCISEDLVILASVVLTQYQRVTYGQRLRLTSALCTASYADAL